MDVIDPAIPLAGVDPLGYSPRSVIRGDDSANGVADDSSVRILKEKEGRECEGFRVGVTHQEKGECEGGGDVLRSECIGNVEFWSVQGQRRQGWAESMSRHSTSRTRMGRGSEYMGWRTICVDCVVGLRERKGLTSG